MGELKRWLGLLLLLFGWYGPQSGDNPATISRQAQQQEVVAATLALLANLR